jgi:hypothetical protein
MLKAYTAPGLKVHGSIAMLTMEDEIGGEGEDNPIACSKATDGGPKVQEAPYDVFCGLSVS